MNKYLPFSGSTTNFISNVETENSVLNINSMNVLERVNNNEIELPSTLEELDRETVDIIDLSVDAALSLKIPFGSTDNKLSRRVFIQEYKKYKEIEEGGEILHYGIAIRWIVNIKKLNSNADISSLPMVTASAQFNSLSASVKFEVIGLTSSEITSLLPSNVDLQADTYVELMNSFEEIKSKIWDDATTINPTTLGVYGTVADEGDRTMIDAVAITYALKKISSGRTLQKAISGISDQPSATKEIVKTVYEEITNSSEYNTSPPQSAREKARNIFKDIL